MWYIYQGERVGQTLKVTQYCVTNYKVWRVSSQAKNGNIKDNLKENA